MLNPAVKFILVFIVAYLVMQSIYTGYLWLYNPDIDPYTELISKLLVPFFENCNSINMKGFSKTQINIGGKAMVNIKEACNGISVNIALLSFVLAFRKRIKNYIQLVPVFLFILFVSNLLRLVFLIYLRKNYPSYFELFHEYIFPMVLYFLAFLMMVYWTRIGKDETSAKKINT